MIAPNPVGQLAEMLNAQDNPWKPLLMIDARSYFDDSGTHRGSVVTVIAGYVATKDVWEAMEKPWRMILGEFQDKGVHCFHATDCLAQDGEFGRVDTLGRQYIYKQLSDILEASREAQPVCALVWRDDWNAVPDKNLGLLCPTAYEFCVDRVLSEVVNWSAQNAGGTPVPVMFAVQKEHENHTTLTYESWKRVSVVKDKIGALAYDYPDRYVPLQAADMLAHEFYRHHKWIHAMKNGFNPPSESVHPRCLDKIIRGRRLKGGLFDRWFLEVFAGGIRRQGD